MNRAENARRRCRDHREGHEADHQGQQDQHSEHEDRLGLGLAAALKREAG